ncbi:putative MAGE domain-containing protein MAGEA13P [Perognathus longimembris pacificus]|uniref:putative MAGE domain-containing protein MAGEA13P n=1 Tax=Perognathus longimembris pacificus TaxID=214514 RepID=UPI002019A4EC|nr:putative MAGE domain-containing protein MAGEA13P [Perognathus longimembris pacificus]
MSDVDETADTTAFSSVLIPGTLEEIPPPPPLPSAAAHGSVTQCLQEASSSSTTMEDTLSSKPKEGCNGQEKEGASASKAHPEAELLLTTSLGKKVVDLVKYLSVKYTTKDLVTEEEIMKNVIKEFKDYYPMIFRNACECMEVVFGIEVKEVDPIRHAYVLVQMLDLTYDGKGNNDEGLPKTGLLILILGLVFMEGNHAPEEKVWDTLRMIGVYAEKKDFIYGDPKKLITEDFVKEKYLEYQLIPNSDPARYEFKWGPRAYAETSKMKVLQFFSKVSGSSPTAFVSLYKEALKDEEEKAKLVLANLNAATVTMDKMPQPKSSSDSCPPK